MSVLLRCPNQVFGVATGTGTLDVICQATKCKALANGAGRTHHIFDLFDGSYENRIEPFRNPEEIRFHPAAHERKQS